MLKDSKCFQTQPEKKQTLCSKLLMQYLLEKLLGEDEINFATYKKALEEVEKRD